MQIDPSPDVILIFWFSAVAYVIVVCGFGSLVDWLIDCSTRTVRWMKDLRYRFIG